MTEGSTSEIEPTGSSDGSGPASSSTSAGDESSSDSSSGSSSSTGEPAEVICGDGMPDIDGVCLTHSGAQPLPLAPVGLASGDFNGDGEVDLVAANTATSAIVLLPGDGAGGFLAAEMTALAEGAAPVALAAGPLSDDGFDDVIVANSGTNTVTILHGGSDGFTLQSLPVGGTPSDVAIVNLDGAAGLDFAVVNTEDDLYSTWISTGAGGYLLADLTDGGPIPFIDTFVWGQVAGTDALDVVFSGDLVIGASPGQGDGSIGGTVVVVADVPAIVQEMAGGDVNDDGELDVAVATAAGVVVLVGDGEAATAEFDQNLAAQHDDVVDVQLADVTGEGNLDVIAVARGDAEIVVFPGHGDGTFGPGTVLPVGAGADSVIAVDLDHDGKKEIVVTDDLEPGLTVFIADP